ncbi:uncharacterized protein LOC143800298 [Ranitomeya variabilis]|uniref:uncharacterized protein LOC143800298 n=1 Tax=Ranitomeya variabilis TaxID=490064 RepID=UPI0040574EEC
MSATFLVLCETRSDMDNYTQDFGFYCSREPMSHIAGKILSALRPGHSDEPCISSTCQEKYNMANDGDADMDYWNHSKEEIFTEKETPSDPSELEATSTSTKNQIFDSADVCSSNTYFTGDDKASFKKILYSSFMFAYMKQ